MRDLIKRARSRLPRNPDAERRVLIAALVAFPITAIIAATGATAGFSVFSVITPIAALAMELLVVVYVRRLPRLVISGLVGGGLAGVVALGAGSRLAMRIVSLTGGRREMTIEGTMFLLIFGAMVGAVIGISIAAALRVWPEAGRFIAITVGSVISAGLILDSEAFEELMHEGAGGWLNFPMFVAFPIAYGFLAVRSVAAVERRIPTGAHPSDPGTGSIMSGASRNPARGREIGQTGSHQSERPGGSTLSPNLRRTFAMLVLGLSVVAAACTSDDSSRVLFIEPTDGAAVSSPVSIVMGAENFILEPAANGVNEGRGHFHIMVDAPCVEPRLTVPPDAQHLHFGKAQTTTVLDLAPGEHFLCLQAADGDHTALRPTDEITITVE